MRILLGLSTAVCLLGGMQGDAFAQGKNVDAGVRQNQGVGTTAPGDLSSNLSLGVGVICDTHDQIKRYLTLYQGSTTAEQAATAVNSETNSPGGCGMASIAFVTGDFLGNVNVPGGIMQVVKILVVAMKTQEGWQSISPTPQYTALFVKLDEA